MGRLPVVHPVQKLTPPRQKPESLRFVGDFIAQIIGPAAEGVDVVEVLMEVLRQQKADYVEILIVMGGEPACVCLRLNPCPGTTERIVRPDEFFRQQIVHASQGIIAVFMWPLWL